MDPATIVGLVSSAAALAKVCGSAATDLNTLVSKYKNAKLAILSMVQALDTMQLAWSRIGKWAQNQAPDALLEEEDFIERLRLSLETGSLVMDALNEELLIYSPLKMGVTQRTKVIWNEGTLRTHQERIRDQASSMTLLLQAIHLPTVGDRNNLLRESKEQFGKSDESAYSIVPSRMSMSIYTGDTIDRGASNSEESLVYKPLTFENELFTARAYKRNFRTPALQRLFKGLRQTISDKTRSPTVAQEIEEGPDGSEADNVTVREAGPSRWSQNETRTITSRRPEGQPAGDEDTSGEIDTAPNAEPPISFAEACKQGKAEIVKTFLESGQDVHVGFSNSWGLLDLSAIHVAAECGHVQVVEILLRYGADKEILSGGSLRTRPLHVAVRAGHVAMVRYLLDNGTNVAAVDGNGAQAIHVAAECGSKVILSLLLDRGVTIDSTRADGAQPLHLASQRWDGANFIKFVCSQGANIEAETGRGYTPLYYASIDNIVDNMKALLELGAAHSPQGPSILGKAIERGHLQATRLLLERGADPNCPVDGERTALHRLFKAYAKDSLSSITCLYMPEIVELLLVYGANVDLQDSNGDTPLHSLCSRGEARHVLRKLQSLQPQLANILLRSMRDADIVNLAGKTALCISIQSRSCRLLNQSLINSGACLLVRKPGIEVRVELEQSSTGHSSILKCYLRHESNTFTKRLGYYKRDGQHSEILFFHPWIDVLRGLLANPQLEGFDFTDDNYFLSH